MLGRSVERFLVESGKLNKGLRVKGSEAVSLFRLKY